MPGLLLRAWLPCLSHLSSLVREWHSVMSHLNLLDLHLSVPPMSALLDLLVFLLLPTYNCVCVRIACTYPPVCSVCRLSSFFLFPIHSWLKPLSLSVCRSECTPTLASSDLLSHPHIPHTIHMACVPFGCVRIP